MAAWGEMFVPWPGSAAYYPKANARNQAGFLSSSHPISADPGSFRSSKATPEDLIWSHNEASPWADALELVIIMLV